MKIINNKMVAHSIPEFSNILGIIYKEEMNKISDDTIKFNIFEINNYTRDYSLNLNTLRYLIKSLYNIYKNDSRSIFNNFEQIKFYKDNCFIKIKKLT